MNKELKEQEKKIFWKALRRSIMWRDSKSGIVERHIDDLIDSLIDKTVQHEQERIVAAVKKYSSYFKRQVSEWGDSYTDTVKGITEEDLLSLITNKSDINKDN